MSRYGAPGTDLSRRDFLKATGASGLAATAGCTAPRAQSDHPAATTTTASLPQSHKVDHVRNGASYPGGMLTGVVYKEAMDTAIFADLMDYAGGRPEPIASGAPSAAWRSSSVLWWS